MVRLFNYRDPFLVSGLFLMLMLCGCSKQQDQVSIVKQQDARSIEQSKKRFQDLCAACHGKQARGGVGPDLTVTRFKYGKNRSTIIQSIMDGRPGGMPSFDSYLKSDDAAALADYLLSIQ
jgi:cytochrome c oxidase cbb3-type subunit 3